MNLHGSEQSLMSQHDLPQSSLSNKLKLLKPNKNIHGEVNQQALVLLSPPVGSNHFENKTVNTPSGVILSSSCNTVKLRGEQSLEDWVGLVAAWLVGRGGPNNSNSEGNLKLLHLPQHSLFVSQYKHRKIKSRKQYSTECPIFPFFVRFFKKDWFKDLKH